MAKLEDIKLRRSYQREIKLLLRTLRFKSKGRRQGEAQRAIRRLRPIAGVLICEIKRKLSPEAFEIYQHSLNRYDRVQHQQRSNTDKIYSLHEPGVSCISKGKGHKKYEFGAKASVTVTSGIIVGALSFHDNPFDGHTLPAVLAQVESVYKRPLAILEKPLGSDHPNVATSLNNLAALYRATKRDSEAFGHIVGFVPYMACMTQVGRGIIYKLFLPVV